ncbi:hypothetical protein [Streptomyces sp. GbtcB6]|uniref:hypothetical protein n=1 Tax=Streptomyces sp. GbtcB6 TaxID=2824751 RepID=UPI001C2F3FCC|nr:hypothetical protein [Streptomyces sp. GbtcB6]
MPALPQSIHAAGDTGLNKASVPIAGERDAPHLVDERSPVFPDLGARVAIGLMARG